MSFIRFACRSRYERRRTGGQLMDEHFSTMQGREKGSYYKW
ncbi:hypothetical protein AB0G02_12255 [Actinosynnema sp. NPDC023658]